MRTYIYKQTKSSTRGYNVAIEVFRVKNNVPEYIGFGEYNTASWKGSRASACNIIHDVDGLKMADDYKLASKNVQVFEI